MNLLTNYWKAISQVSGRTQATCDTVYPAVSSQNARLLAVTTSLDLNCGLNTYEKVKFRFCTCSCAVNFNVHVVLGGTA
jgi:hypothetical protein